MTQQEIMNYRADFPLLRESKVAYLDNAATSQRPDCVLDAQRKFYETHNANPLRGLYQLGMDACLLYTSPSPRDGATRPTTPTPCGVCTNWVWTLRRTTPPPERRCAVF